MVLCQTAVFSNGLAGFISGITMAHRFSEIAFTPNVRAAQERAGSRRAYEQDEAKSPARDRLGPDEVAFLAERDSFYMATVSETGWPYVQHRGGPPGFVTVLDERTIAFPDFRGNRQYVSVGNLAGDDRVSLIFVDYPRRARLRLLGRARLVELANDPALVARVERPDYDARVERVMVITIEAFDWNCPQHITPRYTAPQIAAMEAKLLARIEELEAEVAALRGPSQP
jgi:predicted pyridoxine 5'-phosphate oxidase superfamily flavin-nucleotide-binding protein